MVWVLITMRLTAWRWHSDALQVVQSVVALRLDAFVKLCRLFVGVCFLSFRVISIAFCFVLYVRVVYALFCSRDAEHARHAADAAVDD